MALNRKSYINGNTITDCRNSLISYVDRMCMDELFCSKRFGNGLIFLKVNFYKIESFVLMWNDPWYLDKSTEQKCQESFTFSVVKQFFRYNLIKWLILIWFTVNNYHNLVLVNRKDLRILKNLSLVGMFWCSHHTTLSDYYLLRSVNNSLNGL